LQAWRNTVAGGLGTFAQGINTSGQIVGSTKHEMPGDETRG
jgi:hypothetical protein